MRQKPCVQADRRAGREGHPPPHAQAAFVRREDPHRPLGTARRRQHRRALPARGDRDEPLLQLVEGVPGGREEASGRRHGAPGDKPEVKELRAEAAALKEVLADLTLENRLLKKSMIGDGGDHE